MALFSCQREVSIVDDDAIRSDSRTAVELQTSIGAPVTRVPIYDGTGVDAGKGHFQNGDKVGLYVIRAAAGHTDPIEVVDNAYITPNFDYMVASTLYWEQIGYKALRFSAYYPRVESVATPSAYIFDASAAAGSTPAEKERAADLLIAASPVRNFPDAVADMQFSHAMCKFVLKISNYEDPDIYFTADELRNASVKLFAKQSAKVDLYNAVSSENTAATIDRSAAGAVGLDDQCAVAPSSEKAVRTITYMLAPQAVATDADFLAITIGDYDLEYLFRPAAATATDDGDFVTTDGKQAFTAGNVVTLNVLLRKNDLSAVVTVDYNIDGWVDGTTIDWDQTLESGDGNAPGIYTATQLINLFAAADFAGYSTANNHADASNVIRLWKDIDLTDMSYTAATLNQTGMSIDGQGFTITTNSPTPLFNSFQGDMFNLNIVSNAASDSEFSIIDFGGAANLVNCHISAVSQKCNLCSTAIVSPVKIINSAFRFQGGKLWPGCGVMTIRNSAFTGIDTSVAFAANQLSISNCAFGDKCVSAPQEKTYNSVNSSWSDVTATFDTCSVLALVDGHYDVDGNPRKTTITAAISSSSKDVPWSNWAQDVLSVVPYKVNYNGYAN